MVRGSATHVDPGLKSLPARQAPGRSWGNASHRNVPASRGHAVVLGKYPRLSVPPAAAERPERRRPLAGDPPRRRGHAERAGSHPPAQPRFPAGPSRRQRQGPECATSFRSHVSRRRRLKMTEASWHRGEFWNPGRRLRGAGAGISSRETRPPAIRLSVRPSVLRCARPASQAPRRPALLPSPSTARLSPLRAHRAASWVAAGTSSRNLAAPAGAGGETGGERRRRRTESPTDSAREPPSPGPKPGSADASRTRIVSGPGRG